MGLCDFGAEFGFGWGLIWVVCLLVNLLDCLELSLSFMVLLIVVCGLVALVDFFGFVGWLR